MKYNLEVHTDNYGVHTLWNNYESPVPLVKGDFVRYQHYSDNEENKLFFGKLFVVHSVSHTIGDQCDDHVCDVELTCVSHIL